MKRQLLTAVLWSLAACSGLGQEYAPGTTQHTSTTSTTPTTETTTGTTTTTTSTTTTTYTDPNDMDDDGDGYSENQGDCDDTNPDLNPSTVWYADADADGFTGDTYILQCEDPGAPYDRDNNGDCNDSDPLTFPGAVERCDGEDNDCQGDGEAPGIVTFEDTAGNVSDVTGEFIGTSFSPQTIIFDTDGTYNFCDGTFYVSLFIEADVNLIGKSGTVSLDASGVSQVLQNYLGNTIRLESLTIQNGYTVINYGGGVSIFGGALSASNVLFQNNEAYGGGALYATSTNTLLENVTFQANSADFIAALYASGGTLSVTDTAFYANTSNQVASAMGFENFTDFTCTNCIINNNTSVYDNVGAIAIGGGATVSLNNTDLGVESDTFNDNAPSDIAVYTNFGTISTYNYEDNTSVFCDDNGCGTATTYPISATSPYGQGAAPGLFIGNIFLADDIVTLDRYAYNVRPYNSCTPDFYLYESPYGLTWSLIHSGPGDFANSAANADVYSDNIGIAMTPGHYYFLGILFPSLTCGSFDFYKGTSVASGDAGFGDHAGYVSYSNWSIGNAFSPQFSATVYTGAVQVSH